MSRFSAQIADLAAFEKLVNEQQQIRKRLREQAVSQRQQQAIRSDFAQRLVGPITSRIDVQRRLLTLSKKQMKKFINNLDKDNIDIKKIDTIPKLNKLLKKWKILTRDEQIAVSQTGPLFEFDEEDVEDVTISFKKSVPSGPRGQALQDLADMDEDVKQKRKKRGKPLVGTSAQVLIDMFNIIFRNPDNTLEMNEEVNDAIEFLEAFEGSVIIPENVELLILLFQTDERKQLIAKALKKEFDRNKQKILRERQDLADEFAEFENIQLDQSNFETTVEQQGLNQLSQEFLEEEDEDERADIGDEIEDELIRATEVRLVKRKKKKKKKKKIKGEGSGKAILNSLPGLTRQPIRKTETIIPARTFISDINSRSTRVTDGTQIFNRKTNIAPRGIRRRGIPARFVSSSDVQNRRITIGRGLGKQTNSSYIIGPNGEFGNIIINPTELFASNNLVVSGWDNKKIFSKKIDDTLIALITKRFNSNIDYSDDTIRQFRRLFKLSGLPFNKRSMKANLLRDNTTFQEATGKGTRSNIPSNQRLEGMVGNINVSEIVERIALLISHIKGLKNDQPDLKNEIILLADKLLILGSIDKKEHKQLISKVAPNRLL